MRRVVAGNPVSAYVCCLVFVVRALRAAGAGCAGGGGWGRLRVRLAAAATLDPRPEYARATLALSDADDMPTATLIGKQVCHRPSSILGREERRSFT